MPNIRTIILIFIILNAQCHAFSTYIYKNNSPTLTKPAGTGTTGTNNNSFSRSLKDRQRERRHDTRNFASASIIGADSTRTGSVIATHTPSLIRKHIIAPLQKIKIQIQIQPTSIKLKIMFFLQLLCERIKNASIDLSLALSNPNKRFRNVFLLSLFCSSVYLMVDARITKRRQSFDATSEWGRYADHPSVRGRALFSLLARVSFMLGHAKVVNWLGFFPLAATRTLFKRRQTMDDDVAPLLDTYIDAGLDLDTYKDADIDTDADAYANAPITTTNGSMSSSGNRKSNTTTKSWVTKRTENIRREAGKEFAEGLLRLGPLYIKIGQILSCRDKLLPEEWKSSMERLQDRVPAKSGQEALALAYNAYDGGEEEFRSIFSAFDDVPLAAASLGQVHKCTLRSSNTTVAVKLQRPRLRDIYDKDLALMNKIAKVIDKFAGTMGDVGGVKQSWQTIFQDAEEILYREIDYRDEAENAMRFASDFGLGKEGTSVPCTARSLDGKVLPSAASWLRTPYVYKEISNEKALVMEYLPSIKISNNAKLADEGVTRDEKEYLAECLARSYLRQFCCGKFFSTDPHAGNLGVLVHENTGGSKTKSKSVQLVYYDFGQACNLQDDQASGILKVIEGIIDYDVDKCVSAFQTMGVLADDADLDKVRKKVKSNFETGKIKVKQRKNKKGNVVYNESSSADGRKEIQMQESTESDKVRKNSKSNLETGKMQRKNKKGNLVYVESSFIDGRKEIQMDDISRSEGSKEDEVNDAEIMSYFSLPAEYAFVARALSQMDGVGKDLDSDFDFISAAAPHLVEIKGSEKYLTDEAVKIVSNLQKQSLEWQTNVFRNLGFKYKQ